MNDSIKNDFCLIFNNKLSISSCIFENVKTKTNVMYLWPSLYIRNIKIRKKLNFFIKVFHYGLSFIDPLIKSNYKNKIVLITNETLTSLSIDKLKLIKKDAKALVLFFIDEFFNDYNSMHNVKKIIENERDIFDLIYTFSERDAIEHNMILNTSYYSMIEIKKMSNVKSDLFFIGGSKDRLNKLDLIDDYCKDNNIFNNFYVIFPDYKQHHRTYKNHFLAYCDSVSELINTNVILDLPDIRQYGMTLRYFEAIAYNKKLISTNAHIKDLPYYNDKYMLVLNDIKEIEQIPSEWFKEPMDYNYGYHGEYEPELFLKDIEEKLGTNEKS